jgi:IS605 OrfB family transposase
MSFKTVHCRLTAPEPIRRQLWLLMAESNTPLINKLQKQVSQQPDFENWQRYGAIPEAAVRKLCEPLKATYPGQPARFYASACLMVTYTYESWLALQQSRHRRLEGKRHWLSIVKSDAELIKLCGSNIEAIRHKAQSILNQFDTDIQKDKAKTAKRTKAASKKAHGNKSLIAWLFEAHDATGDVLTRCAIAYLLKNNRGIPDTEEDPQKFAHRIHRKQKEVERLEAQLSARLPKGRDLTGEEFIETLLLATQQIPESVAQATDWQAKLLTRPASLPYPIIYGSGIDVFWNQNAKGRIAVNFSGIGKALKAVNPDLQAYFKRGQAYPFLVYCDQRQLPFFQRFLEDWKTYDKNQTTYPAGLLTLSSALLGWREGEGKGEPWNVNRLSLHCTFDTRLMTAEGTLDVQKEKLAQVSKKASRANSDPRYKTTLTRLENIPERPQAKTYQGNPEILVGLSIGLTNPVSAAVVNGRTGQLIRFYSTRKLLGDKYTLLNRHRREQRQNSLERHKNQERGKTFQPSESELGLQVDRLLAKAITQIAKLHQAGSIVLPNLTHIKELLASEITAKAERKCPGSVEIQNRYAREYRRSIHNWSYNRLIEVISSKALQVGITLEKGFQPVDASPKEQAKDIAIAVYHFRINEKS